MRNWSIKGVVRSTYTFCFLCIVAVFCFSFSINLVILLLISLSMTYNYGLSDLSTLALRDRQIYLLCLFLGSAGSMEIFCFSTSIISIILLFVAYNYYHNSLITFSSSSFFASGIFFSISFWARPISSDSEFLVFSSYSWILVCIYFVDSSNLFGSLRVSVFILSIFLFIC